MRADLFVVVGFELLKAIDMLVKPRSGMPGKSAVTWPVAVPAGSDEPRPPVGIVVEKED